MRESRDSLREEISQNLNENLTEHEVVTETVIYTIDCVEPAHARQTESELSSVLAQSQPSLKIERITDRVRTLESGSKRQDSRVVVRTEVVRDTVYVKRVDTVEVQKRDSSLQVLGLAKRQSRATAYGLQEDPSARSGQATVSGKLSAVSKVLKWIFWILIGLIGLTITVKVCLLRR